MLKKESQILMTLNLAAQQTLFENVLGLITDLNKNQA